MYFHEQLFFPLNHFLLNKKKSNRSCNVRGVFRNNVDFLNNFTMLCSMVIKLYQCIFVSFCHLFAEFGLVLMTLLKVIGYQRESLTLTRGTSKAYTTSMKSLSFG